MKAGSDMEKETRSPLKVGVILDSRVTPAWIYRMLEIIRHADWAEIEFFIADDSSSGITSDWSPGDQAGGLFFRLYMKLERFVCRRSGDVFQRRDISGLAVGSPVIEISVRNSQQGAVVDEDDVSRIRDRGLDVIVLPVFCRLVGGILKCPRYGVWSLLHGDSLTMRNQPASFWEVFGHREVTGTSLHVVRGEDAESSVLVRSYSSTSHYSVLNNRRKNLWKALHFIPRKLRELYETGADDFFGRLRDRNAPFLFCDRGQRKAPGNIRFAGAFTRHLSLVAAASLRDIVLREEWLLMYRWGRGISTSFSMFDCEVAPPRGFLYADPHLVERDGEHFVFFEISPDSGQQGHIAVTRVNRDGTHTVPEKALEQPYHLAYPLIIEYEDSLYMIPDSGHNETVDAYRCDHFPDQWVYHKTLMKDVLAVDPTVFRHNGRWWMFLSRKEEPAASYSDELFLYYADCPLSDSWTPHPMSPIVSDVRKSRSAGPVIRTNGKLYRLSQNCARSYGRGVNIHEIVLLNESEYCEKDIQSLKPEWSPDLSGMHTIANVGDLTVIDVRRRRFRWLEFRRS